MRQIMLLALLALALPTAALADTFSYTTGKFIEGSLTIGFATPFQVQLVGSMNTVILSADINCSLPTACTFSSGTLFSPTAFGGNRESLINGTITKTGGTTGIATIFANLTTFFGGTDGFTKFEFSYNDIKLTGGSAEVVQTPELSTLEELLLGTVALGLAEIARRKLMLLT